jgi:sulfide:quinone oxidoreductase
MKWRTVILGSSYAGLTAAYKLRQHFEPNEMELTVISKSPIVFENTIFPALLTEDVNLNEIQFDVRKFLTPRKINFIESEVTEIRPSSNTVKLRNNMEIEYDYLFIALGGAYDENFREINGNENAVMHHSLEGFLTLKEKIYRYKNRKLRIVIGNAPKSPIEGPSYETALLLNYIAKTKNIEAEVYLVTQSNYGVFGPSGVDKVIKMGNELMERRGIKVIKGNPIKRIKEDAVVLNDGTELEAEIKSILPQLSAPKVVREAGLTDETGFMNVDPITFRSRKFPNVFGVGDVAKSLIPSKVARNAMISAENASAILINELKGKNLPLYSQGILCIIYGGDVYAMFRMDVTKNEKIINFIQSPLLKNVKLTYSRLLVNTAFNLSIHASLFY